MQIAEYHFLMSSKSMNSKQMCELMISIAIIYFIKWLKTSEFSRVHSRSNMISMFSTHELR